MGGPRFLGLGGAFVGLGDDVSTARVNPAGLMTLPRSMDALLAGGDGQGTTAKPAILALGARPFRLFAGALRVGQAAREDLTPLAADPRLSGSPPSASSFFFGASAAMRLSRRLSLGAALDHQKLSLREGSTSPSSEIEAIGSRAKATVFTAGLLFRSDNPEAPRVGFSYRRSVDVESKPVAGATGAAATALRVRTPSIFSAGVGWHYDFGTSRILVTYQQDLLRYSEVRPVTGARPHDDFDFRLGAEASIPIFRECYTGCGSMIQIRGAIVSLAPLPFLDNSGRLSPTGQGPARRTGWAAGASLAPRWAWAGRFKFEAAYSSAAHTWLAGLGFRYPESHRGDLSDGSTSKKR
jgi:hypothetical protein